MRRASRRARGALRRVAVAALSLAIAVTAVVGGRGYVFCAPMAEARAHCCCPHRASAHDAIRVDCCDDRVTPSLPSSETGHASSIAIAPAAIVAILALDLLYGDDAPGASARDHALRAARAGPRERVHERASVYLI